MHGVLDASGRTPRGRMEGPPGRMRTTLVVNFWARRQGIFWLMTLPIIGLAAAVAYVLDTRREFVE